MTQNSIILENVTLDELTAKIKEAVNEAIASKKEDKFLSRKEVREKFGVCYPTVDKGLKTGELIGYRIGGRILMKESEINLTRFVKTKRQ